MDLQVQQYIFSEMLRGFTFLMAAGGSAASAYMFIDISRRSTWSSYGVVLLNILYWILIGMALVAMVGATKHLWFLLSFEYVRRKGYAMEYLSSHDRLYYRVKHGATIDEVAEEIRGRSYLVTGFFDDFDYQPLSSEQTFFSCRSAPFDLEVLAEETSFIVMHNQPRLLGKLFVGSVPAIDDIVKMPQRARAIVSVGKHFDYVIVPLFGWEASDHVLAYYNVQLDLALKDYKRSHNSSTSVTGKGLTWLEWVRHTAMIRTAAKFNYAYQRFPRGEYSVIEEITLTKRSGIMGRHTG